MASNAIETQGTKFEIDTGTGTPEWTHIKEVVSFSGLDGAAAEIDTTSLDSDAKEFLMGLQDWGSFSLECNYLSDDEGQQAVRAAKATRAKQSFRITLSNGRQMTFSAFVLSAGMSGGVDAKVDTSFSLRITGDVTFAAGA